MLSANDGSRPRYAEPPYDTGRVHVRILAYDVATDQGACTSETGSAMNSHCPLGLNVEITKLNEVFDNILFV